jgi:flagellar biosynthesis protein FlhF
MDIRTYRAASLQEALDLVRRDLGPDAAMLHAREAPGGWLRWLTGGKEIEVVASNVVEVPSRLPPARKASLARPELEEPRERIEPADEVDYRSRFRRELKRRASGGRELGKTEEKND